MPMRLRSKLPEFAEGTEWVNGEVIQEELVNKSVLVHFWGVSCRLCKLSLPIINFWREKYGEKYNLQVIGVHTPRSKQDFEIELVQETIAEYELEHPVVIDNAHKVTDAFQNECVPAYYLFDNQQQLRHFQAGERGLKMFEQRLLKILGVKK